MNKAILISIKPKYVAKILNGEKTIEIRKIIPKCDLPIDVYIYCTKEEELYKFNWNKTWYENFKHFADMGCDQAHALDSDNLSGKVVAKFTLNKCQDWHFYSWQEITKKGCVSDQKLQDYCKHKKTLYIWHIDNLEIFDKPKELSEFRHYGCGGERNKCICGRTACDLCNEWGKPLTKAPQSWCYVENL